MADIAFEVEVPARQERAAGDAMVDERKIYHYLLAQEIMHPDTFLTNCNFVQYQGRVSLTVVNQIWTHNEKLNSNFPPFDMFADAFHGAQTMSPNRTVIY